MSIHSSAGSQNGSNANARWSKSAASSRFDDRERVANEPLGHAAAVVVGRLDQPRILDQIDSEQERSHPAGSRLPPPRRARTGEGGRGCRRCSRGRRSGVAPPGGNRVQVPLEVADDPCTRDRAIAGRNRLGARTQDLLAHVERDEALERAAALSASSSSRVLSELPAPSSTSGARLGRRRDLRGTRRRGSRARRPSGSTRAAA